MVEQRFCSICGKALKAQVTGRPRQTCSDACRQKAQRRRDAIRFGRRRGEERAIREGRALLRAFERGRGPIEERAAFRVSHDMPYFICPDCERPYVKLTASGPAPQTCTLACSKARRKRVKAARAAMQRAREEGPEWKAGWIEGLIRRRAPFRICEQCRDPFVPQGIRGPKARYCSARCRWRAWKARRRVCPVCGTIFDPRDRTGHMNRKYCNPKCTSRARQWKALDRLRAKPRDAAWRGGYGRGAPRTEAALKRGGKVEKAERAPRWDDVGWIVEGGP